MAIVKRGNRYQVKVRAGSGITWWTATCPSRKAAEALEREMLEARIRGESWVHPRDRQPVGGPLTLRELAETFVLFHREQLAAKTLKRYAHELEEFVCWAEDRGQGSVSSLSRPLLQAWQTELLSAGRWSRPRLPQTAAKVVQTVILLWRWADEHDDEYSGWLGQVPKPRAIKLTRNISNPRPAPTWADMDDLVSALEVEWARRMAWIQRFTGARCGEVALLRWADVDLSNQVAHFRAATTKGGYGGRTIPLAGALVDELRRWERSDTWLCSATAARTVGTSRAARVFTTAWHAAGVAPVSWARRPTHALRAGVQTGLYALGAHPDAVRMLVGHQLDDLRRRYVDPAQAFDLRHLVTLIPPVGAS